MLKRVCLLIAGLIIISLAGCTIVSQTGQGTNQPENKNLNVMRYPPILDLGRGKLSLMPFYDKYRFSGLQVDLRSYDMTSYDMSRRLDDLMHSDFDIKTRWPYKLPGKFNPKKVLKLGMNPGLNVRSLHNKGISGKGIGIAIIGDPILVEHEEYSEQLRFYGELSRMDSAATVSGTAAASLAAGKTVGVAPDSDLYYLAGDFGTYQLPQDEKNEYSARNPLVTEEDIFSILSQAISRILDINSQLPEENKIRVICITADWPSFDNEISNLEGALSRAKENGIFIITPQIYDIYDNEFDFNGLGRNPMEDPDKFTSYLPGIAWSNNYYSFGRSSRAPETLLVPMDSRTAAAPTGRIDYAYYSMTSEIHSEQNNSYDFPTNGKSMAAVYISGLYALACQVKPEITPEEFWDMALKTGDTLEIKRTNINYKLSKIVNPVKLVEILQKD